MKPRSRKEKYENKDESSNDSPLLCLSKDQTDIHQSLEKNYEIIEQLSDKIVSNEIPTSDEIKVLKQQLILAERENLKLRLKIQEMKGNNTVEEKYSCRSKNIDDGEKLALLKEICDFVSNEVVDLDLQQQQSSHSMKHHLDNEKQGIYEKTELLTHLFVIMFDVLKLYLKSVGDTASKENIKTSDLFPKLSEIISKVDCSDFDPPQCINNTIDCVPSSSNSTASISQIQPVEESEEKTEGKIYKPRFWDPHFEVPSDHPSEACFDRDDQKPSVSHLVYNSESKSLHGVVIEDMVSATVDKEGNENFSNQQARENVAVNLSGENLSGDGSFTSVSISHSETVSPHCKQTSIDSGDGSVVNKEVPGNGVLKKRRCKSGTRSRKRVTPNRRSPMKDISDKRVVDIQEHESGHTNVACVESSEESDDTSEKVASVVSHETYTQSDMNFLVANLEKKLLDPSTSPGPASGGDGPEETGKRKSHRIALQAVEPAPVRVDKRNRRMLSIFLLLNTVPKFGAAELKGFSLRLINAFSSKNMRNRRVVISRIAQYLHVSTRNPLVHLRNGFPAVVITREEKCIAKALFGSEARHPIQFKGLVSSTVQTLYQIVVTKVGFTSLGLAALCRLFTEICKHERNTRRPTELCCELLKMNHKDAPFLIASVAGVWKDLFSYPEDAPEEEVLLQSILAHRVLKVHDDSVQKNTLDWESSSRVFSSHFCALTVTDPEQSIAFLKMKIELMCSQKSFTYEFQLKSSLVLVAAEFDWNWVQENVVNEFIVKNLENFATTEVNKEAFDLFSDLYVEVSFLSPEKLDYCLLYKFFEKGKFYRGRDYVTDSAARALIKALLQIKEPLSESLSDWFKLNQNNPDWASFFEDIFRRRIMSNYSDQLRDSDMYCYL